MIPPKLLRRLSSAKALVPLMKVPRLESTEYLKAPWSWFDWFTTLLALMTFALIIPLNYALQGYQIVSSYHLKFNTTSPHWFDRFYPAPKRKSQCDAHIFTVGDQFTTSAGIFLWSIVGEDAAPAQGQGRGASTKQSSQQTWSLTYSAQTLDWCDINEMQISVNSATQAGQLSLLFQCYKEDFFFVATAKLDIGDADYSSFRDEARGYSSSAYQWAADYAAEAGLDLIYQMQNISRTNASAPTQLSFLSFPVQCPAVLDATDIQTALVDYGTLTNTTFYSFCDPHNATMRTDPPDLALDWTDELTTSPPAGQEYQPLISNAVNNVFQAMLAVGRADLGNIFPNNFLNNTITVLQQTPPVFLPPFTEVAPNGSLVSSEGSFYNYNVETNWMDGWLTNQNYSTLSHEVLVPYLCHLTAPKSVGSIIVSVFSATVTMWFTAWKFYTWFANLLVKRMSRPSDVSPNNAIHHRQDEESAMGGYGVTLGNQTSALADADDEKTPSQSELY